MDKALKIARLQETIDNMKKLEDSKFKYHMIVYDYDIVLNCGTVCCVYGWYPKWYPNLFYWEDDHGDYDVYGPELSVYHGLDHPTIAYLFYGHHPGNHPVFFKDQHNAPGQGLHDNLQTVIARFEYVLSKIDLL